MEEGARPRFGNRHLTDESKVFEHNAWDDVEWSDELEQSAKEKITLNSTVLLSPEQCEKYEDEADKFWDSFYNIHQNKFFKDRHWLFTEFNELAPKDWTGPCKANSISNEIAIPDIDESVDVSNKDILDENYPGSTFKTRIFEVGCGVGNTVFPLLQANNDPSLYVYCCDFADSAIDIVKEHSLYDASRCHAFVCNVAQDEDPVFPFPDHSLDFVVLIFVLSAIHPERMLIVLKRLAKLLKKGGMILFRDYGRYDMAQLRFKKGRCLSENFYVRGDGTRVYFFTQDEIHDLLVKAGFTKEQNIVDRRLQINRGRQLKMYRVWVQCKYRIDNDEANKEKNNT